MALALVHILGVDGFISPVHKPTSILRTDYLSQTSESVRQHVASRTSLRSTSNKEKEKELRAEIMDKASLVEGEEKYKYASQIGPVDEEAEKPIVGEVDEDDESEVGKLKRRMEKLTRKRNYALFLAEKGAEVIEGLFPRDVISPVRKERVVVLGTGWGAASFLKGIDTNLYDVTIISPRNYFLFTPMLAGASVGTVEYRSITEPVREVRAEFMVPLAYFQTQIYP